MRSKDINSRISKCRTRLLLDWPWWGSLCMRLRMENTETIPTFATDGTSLYYNPKFAETLADEEIIAVLSHEVMHCCLLHMFRKGNRDHMQWNIAADYAINIELQKAGFKLPKDCLLDPAYDGMSSEQIYALRAKQGNPSAQGGQGSGNGNGQVSTGQFTSAPSSPQNGQNGQGTGQGKPAMTAQDWALATEQATQACKGAGKMPTQFEEMVKQARKTPADWRSILREFIENTLPSDYSWTSPNRRHIANNVYLPGVTRENLGHIAIAIDTSGSIDSGLLAAFCSELNAIVQEAKPDRVSVIYCDSKVHRTDEFGQDEYVEMKAIGRGGTAFIPVFEAIAKWPEQPVCLLYMTDLDSSDTPSEPDYPCLWVTSECVSGVGPFGRTVRISEGK